MSEVPRVVRSILMGSSWTPVPPSTTGISLNSYTHSTCSLLAGGKLVLLCAAQSLSIKCMVLPSEFWGFFPPRLPFVWFSALPIPSVSAASRPSLWLLLYFALGTSRAHGQNTTRQKAGVNSVLPTSHVTFFQKSIPALPACHCLKSTALHILFSVIVVYNMMAISVYLVYSFLSWLKAEVP